MNKCIFCGAAHSRMRANSVKIPARYCSVICIKRAWHLKHNPQSRSYGRSDAFWDTETGTGLKWELWAAKQLGATHLAFNKYGCDLNWNGLAVDVKSCELYKRQLKNGRAANVMGSWVFNRNKQKVCDYFLCVCLIDGTVHKALMIPGNKFPPTGATIGFKSKYDMYPLPAGKVSV